MEHPPHIPVSALAAVTTTAPFLTSPLGIALLMIVSSVGGGVIKDRLTTETRDTASSVRIDAIDQRLHDHLAEAVTRPYVDAAFDNLTKRLDEIRGDVRDLRAEIDGTKAAAAPRPRR